MSYKTNNSYTILVAASMIALVLITITGFNHSYTAFAVNTKKTSVKSSTGSSSGSSNFLGGGGSSSSATTTANSNILTKKELSSLISCINTANKSAEGITHKVVTNCLDTARGITPATASSSTTTGISSGSSSSSLAPSATSKS
jgi:hypothetical protein